MTAGQASASTQMRMTRYGSTERTPDGAARPSIPYSRLYARLATCVCVFPPSPYQRLSDSSTCTTGAGADLQREDFAPSFCRRATAAAKSKNGPIPMGREHAGL